MSQVIVKSRIGQIVARAQQSVPDRVERVAQDIAEVARGRAPRGSTGALADSIDVVQVSPFEYAVTADRPWRYLEFGTVHMGARPFITPAAQGQTSRLGRLIGGAYE